MLIQQLKEIKTAQAKKDETILNYVADQNLVDKVDPFFDGLQLLVKSHIKIENLTKPNESLKVGDSYLIVVFGVNEVNSADGSIETDFQNQYEINADKKVVN